MLLVWDAKTSRPTSAALYNNQSATEITMDKKIKRSLSKYRGKKGHIFYFLLLFAPFFLFLMGILNLYTASKWGNTANLDNIDLVKMWFSGIDINSNYSGAVLKSLERLETAIMQFGFALVFGIVAYNAKIQRTAYSKIIELLKNHNEWDNV
jgi:hypothetical protein